MLLAEAYTWGHCFPRAENLSGQSSVPIPQASDELNKEKENELIQHLPSTTLPPTWKGKTFFILIGVLSLVGTPFFSIQIKVCKFTDVANNRSNKSWLEMVHQSYFTDYSFISAGKFLCCRTSRINFYLLEILVNWCIYIIIRKSVPTEQSESASLKQCTVVYRDVSWFLRLASEVEVCNRSEAELTSH